MAPADAHSPYTIENSAGGGAVVLICEHASNAVPDAWAAAVAGLTPEERQAHIAWDPGALAVTRLLSQRLDAPAVTATVSRLVLDLNRDPSAPDSIPDRSESTDIPGNRDLADEDRRQRVERIYVPFHAAVSSLLDRRKAAGQPTALVSIHSYTPVYHGKARPWHCGIIFDADQRMARPVIADLKAEAGLVVGVNEPYSPADRVYHTLHRHAESRGLPAVMIEIRNDLLLDEAAQVAWADRLAPILARAAKAVLGEDAG